MSSKQLYKIYKFSKACTSDYIQEFEEIRSRFNEFANKQGDMSMYAFKLSMGLLGFGEAEFLTNRIFSLITQDPTFNLIDFIKFLSLVIHGSELYKAKLSFKFIDRKGKKVITREDIASIAVYVSLLWGYLTGEQAIPDSEFINYLCQKIGMTERKQEVDFEQYLDTYDYQNLDWWGFFNGKRKKYYKTKTKTYYNHINLRQLEQTLNAFNHYIYYILHELNVSKRGGLSFQPEDVSSMSQEIKTLKGPLYIDCHTTPLRGDNGNIDSYVQGFYSILEYLHRNSISSESLMMDVSGRLQALSYLGLKILREHNFYDNKMTSLEYIKEENDETKMNRRTTIINKGNPAVRKASYIYFGHENWNLLINMMLGIRKGVKCYVGSTILPLKSAPPSLYDFTVKYTYQLVDKRNDQYDKYFCYTFVDYAPKIFDQIREANGITTYQYLRSIGPYNLIGSLMLGRLSNLTEQVSSGKSGSFFYYSEDARYLIKTMQRQYFLAFRNILPNYHRFFMETTDTFVLRVYGLHKLVREGSSVKYYLFVMNNFFSSPLQIHVRYDLKGSKYGRQSKNYKWDRSIALKDLDLVDVSKQGTVFALNSTDKQKILAQIKRDVHFFSLNNITNYSLLVGIHRVQKDGPRVDKLKQDQHFSGYLSKNHNYVYFFGLIDFFTYYQGFKAFGSQIASLITKESTHIAPLEYEKRLIDFIYTYVFNG